MYIYARTVPDFVFRPEKVGPDIHPEVLHADISRPVSDIAGKRQYQSPAGEPVRNGNRPSINGLSKALFM
jgi:hypothetical protein